MIPRFVRGTAVVLALTALAVVLPSPGAAACTCARLPTGNPIDLAGRHSNFYDHAFIGTIDRIEDPVEADPGTEGYAPGTYVPYVLDVEVHLVGTSEPEKVILLQHSRPAPDDLAPDCSYGFAPGRRYLVEAHENPDGTFLTNGCSFNQPYGSEIVDAETTTAPRSPPEARRATESSDGLGSLPLVVAAGVLVIGGAVVVALSLRRPGPD